MEHLDRIGRRSPTTRLTTRFRYPCRALPTSDNSDAVKMPPPSAAQQKVLIAQFVALTGQSERQATRVRIFRVHLPYVDHREPSWSLTRINLMTSYCSTRHGLGYGCIGLCFSGAYLARSCIIMIVWYGVANIHFNSTSRMPVSSSTKLSIRKLLPSFLFFMLVMIHVAYGYWHNAPCYIRIRICLY